MHKSIIKVMVVDDHVMLLHGLCLLLNAEADIEVVGQAANGEEALALAGTCKPDIILLDITLQKMSGLDLIKQLLSLVPKSRIIMLTMHDNVEYLQKALQRGAKGFVLKKGLEEDLLYAIRSVMRGEVYIHPSLLQSYIPGTGGKTPVMKDDDVNSWAGLSDREQEILIHVARGYTSKEIAEKCLLSEKTVATYRSRGMSKLGLEKRSQLVRLVMRLGKMG